MGDTNLENLTPEKEREWFPLFLAALRATGNVRASCEKAKITRETAYDNRKSNPSFAARWDAAIEDACDSLEAVAWLRAKRSSDTLLIFLLKAHRPEKYRETTRNINFNLTLEQAAQLTDEELDEELKRRGIL